MQSLLFLVVALARAAALSCSECSHIQELIHHSISRNISALEKAAVAGTTSTATVEIGQIVWRVCGSEAWKEARLSAELGKACNPRPALECNPDSIDEAFENIRSALDVIKNKVATIPLSGLDEFEADTTCQYKSNCCSDKAGHVASR